MGRYAAGLAGFVAGQPRAALLDRFHAEKALADRPEQGAFVPMEPSGLAGLGVVNGQGIRNFVGVLAPAKEVTLDVDAHPVQTTRQEAPICYEGYPAYQPLLVQWAETGLVLADQFRDGNVPAGHGIKELVDRAYDALPAGDWQVKVRSDSAAYQWDVLDHWNDRGWRFAVSAGMSVQLKAEIERLPWDAWHFRKEERGGVVREWAEVPFVPQPQAGEGAHPALPLPGDPSTHSPGSALL
ncbi:MAG: transposase [Chloroflexi bacterium]|nr:transposase [Chloroflexota bacterium]